MKEITAKSLSVERGRY